MTLAVFYSLLSVVGISLLSLVGIALFLAEERFTKQMIIYLVSFSTGALFGDVFFHIFPQMAEEGGFAV